MIPGADCAICPLSRKGEPSTPIYGRGDTDPRVVLIGEGPGRDEVRLGKVFIGRSGQLLQRTLDALDAHGVWLTNTALCRGLNDKDKVAAANCCRERLMEELRDKKPGLLVTMGNIPSDVLLGRGEKITARRGRVFYSQELNVHVLPTFHPANVLRKPTNFTDFSFDLRKAFALFQNGGPSIVEPKFSWSLSDGKAALESAERVGWGVLDVETTGLDVLNDDILCLVIATDEGVWIVPRESVLIPTFRSELQNCRTKWIGHGSQFDRKFLMARLQVDIPFAFDTLLAHYALDERKNTHALKHLAMTILDAPDWAAPLQRHLGKGKNKSYANVPLDVLYQYAAYDGYYTHKLAEHFADAFQKFPNQLRLVRELLIPASNVLADVEFRGVRIDTAAAKVAMDSYPGRLEVLEQDLVDLVGHDYNPRSNPQTWKVLYDELSLPPIKGKGPRCADKEVLRQLADLHPFPMALLRYRQMHKTYSTYVKPLATKVDTDGRIRAHFWLPGTVTGRLSSSGPNLQNITKKDRDGERPEGTLEIQNFFIASPGMKLIYIDLSQIEYRLLAVFTQEPLLLDAYRSGGDLHAATAEAIFGPTFTPAQRSFAKTINFMLLYGGGIGRLSRMATSVGMSRADAERFYRGFLGRIPRVQEWKQGIIQRVQRDHYIESRTGRRRRFPLLGLSRQQDAFMFREAVNFLPQACASDATLKSLIRIHHEMPQVHILLTVHDSILVECDERIAEAVERAIVLVMEETARGMYGDDVPWVANAGIGDRWGEIDV